MRRSGDAKRPIDCQGQGKALPWECPYKGQWLIEGALFFFIPETAAKVSATAVEWNFPSRPKSLGIDARFAARELRISTEELFEFNAVASLKLLSADPLHLGGIKGRLLRLTFQVKDR